MRPTSIFVLAAQLSVVLALPTAPVSAPNAVAAGQAKAGEKASGAAGGAKKEGAEKEKKKNERDIAGQFGVAVALQAGATKQDVKFPPGKNGVFEVEFQNNATGRTLTVTENKNPPPPPAGFVALEPSSYKVSLAEGADGIALQQIDYILNPNNRLDIRQGKIGRLCTEVNAFVIDKNVGELEFEEDENELKLVVKNMNAEWGIFLPQAARAAPATPATPATPAAPATGAGAGAGGGANKSMLDIIRSLLGLA